MADFADLRPIITNTKKRGKFRTTRSSPSPIAEEPTPIDNLNDEMLIANSDGTLEPKKKDKTKRINQNAKYITLDELNKITPTGGRGEYDEDAPFTDKQWLQYIGFLSVRLLSPFILVLHCFLMMFCLYYQYGFDVSNIVASDFPKLMIPLVVNLFLVHFFNKWLFKNSYYKRRR